MKVIFKNSSLVFTNIKEMITANVIYGNISTVDGTFLNESQTDYEETSRFIVTEYFDVSEYRKYRINCNDIVSDRSVIILYYDSDKNFIAKSGTTLYDYISFVDDMVYDIFDDISDFAINSTAVDKETITSNTTYWRIGLRNPTPTTMTGTPVIQIG